MGESLYRNPKGLYPFQVDGVVYCYARPENIAVWDTGIGKSHLAMATAAMLFEDDLIDHVLLVCEKNKLDPNEWPRDLAKFTDLTWGLYHGTPAKRAKLLESPPQVILTTYETARNDAGKLIDVKGRKTPKLVPSKLIEALVGLRIFIVYDEMTKLGNRKSGLHKGHDLLVQELRRQADTRVLGLTATPIERSPENFYNLGRILIPGYMGTVAQFEKDHVKYRDVFGRPTFKNLSSDDCDPDVVPFTDRIKPIMLRKRKTDADVIDQFPETVEEFTYVDLGEDQRALYEAVDSTFEGTNDKILWQVLRMVAAHPMSLLHSKGKMAQQVVRYVGEDTLQAISSAKTERLVQYLTPLIQGQGAQAVVFTFFGPSVIPSLKEALDRAEIGAGIYYGDMSDRAKEEAKALFRSGYYRVLLSSDAGGRGINLPEATYAIEYELALTHAMRTQRLNRIHRIDSTAPSVTFQSFIARDTVEQSIADTTLIRNEWADKILDGDAPDAGFVSATMRKRAMKMAEGRV